MYLVTQKEKYKVPADLLVYEVLFQLLVWVNKTDIL